MCHKSEEMVLKKQVKKAKVGIIGNANIYLQSELQWESYKKDWEMARIWRRNCMIEMAQFKQKSAQKGEMLQSYG